MIKKFLFRPEQASSLAYLTQNGMTFLEVENLLKETTHTLYPVVVSREHPYIVGQIQRRDLQIVLSMYCIQFCMTIECIFRITKNATFSSIIKFYSIYITIGNSSRFRL